jgi:drug/metabolite transporter (DMT)-like permease
MSRNKLYVLISYFLIYTIWSSTYLAIRISVRTFPTFLFTGIRWLVSAFFIILIVLVKDKKAFAKISRKEIINAAIIGVVLLFLGNGILSESEKVVDSYIAAVTFSVTPIIMVIFDYFINKKKIGGKTIPSILLGILGVAILNFDKASGFFLDFYTVLLLLSLTMWSLGSALSHKLKLPENLLANLGIQMLAGGVVSLVVSSIQGNYSVGAVSTESIIALLYLIVFGSVGMVAYVYLLKHEPLSRISTYTFVNTIGAVLLGLLFGEKLSNSFLIAIPIILVALILILWSRTKDPHMEIEAEK